MTDYLKPEEYDACYFDGASQRYKHNAGYSEYKRWCRHEGVNSSGEYWKDKAIELVEKFDLKGKKTLELGCAKGFLVHDMLELGVNAFGLDVSEYARNCAEDEKTKQRIFLGDAREMVKTFKDKEFDFVFSLKFLECIHEQSLELLNKQLTRISKEQYHEFAGNGNEYYTDENIIKKLFAHNH